MSPRRTQRPSSGPSDRKYWDALTPRERPLPSLINPLLVSLLGGSGAVLANMMSEILVIVPNGPVFRHLVYYLFVRPVLGAFTGFLFYVLAQSHVLFSIEVEDSALVSPIHIVLSGQPAVDFAYIIISIVAGFAAEKFLGPVMDKVLNRLFTTAEKRVQSMPPEPAES